MRTEVRTPASSPGQHETHYSPGAPAYRFTRAQVGRVLRDAQGAAVMFFGKAPADAPKNHFQAVRDTPATPRQYAKHLYEYLRELDQRHPARIFIEMPPDEPQWLAVRDRLLRATRPLSPSDADGT